MRKKKPRLDISTKRPSIEECLPQDALEAIMAYLDWEARCTARLVSKTFCAAASAHVCKLRLKSSSSDVSFHRYPHVKHVTVNHFFMNLPRLHSLAQLDPRLRDLATSLAIRHNHGKASMTQTRDDLSHAALMPKLRELHVGVVLKPNAASLARCTNLEVLGVHECSISVARTVATMTRLTAINISSVLKDGKEVVSRDTSWLGHATNLKKLQSLSIDIQDGALTLIGNLTSLTGLTVLDYPDEEACSIAPLIRLTRLRTFCMEMPLTESNLRIVGSLGSGSLVNLVLQACDEASADCGRFLARQTALRELRLDGRQVCNLRHLGPLRIELLQRLGLSDLDVLDAEGLSVLCRATSLTRLGIGTCLTDPQRGLSQVLPRLTQLRFLSWCEKQDDGKKVLELPSAVSPLTGLTELIIISRSLDNGDMRALLVLTGLRRLELGRCRLTNEVLPELGVLTNLNTLRLWGCGVTSLAPVSEILDPRRTARGLQPLNASV